MKDASVPISSDIRDLFERSFTFKDFIFLFINF